MKHPTCSRCGFSLMRDGKCSNERCEDSPHPEAGVTLLNLEQDYPPLGLFNGRRWGNWELDANSLCLVHVPEEYEIDLQTIDDPAQMLDWIFQIETKIWATEKDRADLISAFEAIFDPQANLCSHGRSKTIVPKKFLFERIRPNRKSNEGDTKGARKKGAP